MKNCSEGYIGSDGFGCGGCYCWWGGGGLTGLLGVVVVSVKGVEALEG